MATPSRISFAFDLNRTTSRALEITVLHSNARASMKAVQQVARLAQDLAADIRLLVLQVVPYPLPIESPDVPVEFTSDRLVKMLETLALNVRVDIRVGRDHSAMLASAFSPGSLVVVAGGRRWWPRAERKLAKLIRRWGHHVIFTNAE